MSAFGLDDEDFVRDVIGWDVESWSKWLYFIEDLQIDMYKKYILEIGSRDGGVSLYCALRGGIVTCSDLNGPTEKARTLHGRYNVASSVSYRTIDALDMSNVETNSFDIIIFKAVLGWWKYGSLEQLRFKENIKRCLKHNGLLIFCDSMRGSIFHRLGRRIDRNILSHRGMTWNYAEREDILSLFNEFQLIKENYFGFIRPFSRIWNKYMLIHKIFGKVDDIFFNQILPRECLYIGAYAFKNG